MKREPPARAVILAKVPSSNFAAMLFFVSSFFLPGRGCARPISPNLSVRGANPAAFFPVNPFDRFFSFDDRRINRPVNE